MTTIYEMVFICLQQSTVNPVAATPLASLLVAKNIQQVDKLLQSSLIQSASRWLFCLKFSLGTVQENERLPLSRNTA